MRTASELRKYGIQPITIPEERFIIQPLIDRLTEFLKLISKEGESTMTEDKSTRYRTRFSWPPVDVMVKKYEIADGDVFNGYMVTMPDGTEYYVTDMFFRQLFVAVSPKDDKQAEFSGAGHTAAHLAGKRLSDEYYKKACVLSAQQASAELDAVLTKAQAVWTTDEADDFLAKNKVVYAGLKSLNERWRPIANAESIVEMGKIQEATKCAFCKLYGSRCNKCELYDTIYQCCWEFSMWNKYYEEGNYSKAKLAANALCRRIEDVIRNAGGIV